MMLLVLADVITYHYVLNRATRDTPNLFSFHYQTTTCCVECLPGDAMSCILTEPEEGHSLKEFQNAM